MTAGVSELLVQILLEGCTQLVVISLFGKINIQDCVPVYLKKKALETN